MKNNNISFFLVSFKQGFVSPKLPIATFEQNGKKLNFLLDSGSDNNVINKEMLSTLNHEKIETVTNLAGVGGVSKTEVCRIKFSCGDQEYTEDFLITDLSQAFGLIEQEHCIPLHGIIGSSFLRKNNIVMDFEKLIAYSKEKKE